MATTNFTNAVTLSEAAWFDDVDTFTYSTLTGVAGTNTVTAGGPISMTAYAANQRFWFLPAVTNTAATTINITPSGGSALGAKNIFSGGNAIVAGELVASVPALIQYDGTQFNLLNTAFTKGSTATTFTFDGSGGDSGSITVTYQKIGRFVVLNIPSTTATSGTGSAVLLSNTAIPAAFRPTAEQHALGPALNNGVDVTTPGKIIIRTDGLIGLYRDLASTAYTNTATGGTGHNCSVTYYVG